MGEGSGEKGAYNGDKGVKSCEVSSCVGDATSLRSVDKQMLHKVKNVPRLGGAFTPGSTRIVGASNGTKELKISAMFSPGVKEMKTNPQTNQLSAHTWLQLHCECLR